MFFHAGNISRCTSCALFLAATTLLTNGASGKNYNDGSIKKQVFDNDHLPGDGHEWVSVGPATGYKPPGRAIREQGVQLTAGGGNSPTVQFDGSWAVDSFFDVYYEIDFEMPGGEIVHTTGSGIAHLVGTAPPSAPGDPVRTFDTEMLSLNLTGDFNQGSGGPADPFMLRESPTKPSLGQAVITALPGGEFRIDSFFDVFTELSLDGGTSWAAGQPVPEPASLALAALAGLGLWRARRSRR